MNNTLTNILLGVAIVLLAYMAFFKVSHVLGAASPAGATFNDAKVAAISFVPISLTSTTTSILNTDGTDRIIDSSFASCATSSGAVSKAGGAGVASWTWQMATTAIANLGLQNNTNYAANLTVPTSTSDNEYAASTTNPTLAVNRFWPTNTYLTTVVNASSTTTGIVCQVGVYYHGT